MRWFYWCGGIFLLLSLINLGLSHDVFPLGIVSFEVPASLNELLLGLSKWSYRQTILAYLSLSLDFLFIFSYIMVAKTCFGYLRSYANSLVFKDRLLNLLFKVQQPLFMAFVLAGTLDFIENIGLLWFLTTANELIVLGEQSSDVAHAVYLIAKFSAIVKFLLIGFSMTVGALTGLLLKVRLKQNA